MTQAVGALAALAQETRLGIYRLLVEAGPDGMPAGQIGEAFFADRALRGRQSTAA